MILLIMAKTIAPTVWFFHFCERTQSCAAVPYCFVTLTGHYIFFKEDFPMFDPKNVSLGIAPIGWCNDDMP